MENLKLSDLGKQMRKYFLKSTLPWKMQRKYASTDWPKAYQNDINVTKDVMIHLNGITKKHTNERFVFQCGKTHSHVQRQFLCVMRGLTETLSVFIQSDYGLNNNKKKTLKM